MAKITKNIELSEKTLKDLENLTGENCLLDLDFIADIATQEGIKILKENPSIIVSHLQDKPEMIMQLLKLPTSSPKKKASSKKKAPVKKVSKSEPVKVPKLGLPEPPKEEEEKPKEIKGVDFSKRISKKEEPVTKKTKTEWKERIEEIKEKTSWPAKPQVE